MSRMIAHASGRDTGAGCNRVIKLLNSSPSRSSMVKKSDVSVAIHFVHIDDAFMRERLGAVELAPEVREQIPAVVGVPLQYFYRNISIFLGRSERWRSSALNTVPLLPIPKRSSRT